MTAPIDLPDRTTPWELRPEGSWVGFRGRAHRLAPAVAATFTGVQGQLTAESVQVEVDVRTMTTGVAAWDAVVTAADPFDVGQHPVARYRSTRVTWHGDRALVEGVLVLRGRSAPVVLRARCTPEADGKVRLQATGGVDRRAFGLRLEVPGCGVLVPGRLELSVDAVAAPTPAGCETAAARGPAAGSSRAA